MKKIYYTFLYCLFLILLPCVLIGQSTGVLVLRNATIVDGRSVVKPYTGTVLVKNGKIAQIYKKNPGPIIGVEDIDCSGKYIVPGLIDGHVHLATMDLTDLARAQRTTDNTLENMLRHGITTVRDMVGNAPYLASNNAAIKAGKKKGPVIFYAAQFAGPSYFKMFDGSSLKRLGTSAWERSIYDTTNIDRAVLQAKEAGVTGIKAYANLNKVQLKAIVQAAQKYGLQVWCHSTIFPIKPSDEAILPVQSLSHAADIIFEQIPADSIEIRYVWSRVYKGMQVEPKKLEPLFAQMKKNSISLDGTLYHATQNKLNYAIDILKLAHQSGIRLVGGTDWIYPETDQMIPLYNEVDLYIKKVGLSPLEAIETITYNAARVIGLKDRGYIACDNRADLLILDKNPLEDIQNLFLPSVVIQGGRKVY